MNRPARVCYLCGKTQAELPQPLTNDHVISRCFFPAPLPPNLLTLPCCVGCQKHYKDDEEYVRNAFASVSNLSANAPALQAWKKTHRSLKYRPALYSDFLRNIVPVSIGGHVRPALGFSQERTEKVMRKIVLGLHYHHLGVRLPPEVTMRMHYQPDNALEDLQKKYMRYHKRYDNAVSYAGALTAEGDSIWWLTFYQSVLMIVFVGANICE